MDTIINQGMDMTHLTKEMAADLALAQGEIEDAAKTSDNPFFSSTYADLAQVLQTARPIYSKRGMSLLQGSSFDGEHVTVTSALCHKSGGYVTTSMSCKPGSVDKKGDFKFRPDAQGVGGATTYLRRYAAAALYCMGQVDDDGNGTGENYRRDRDDDRRDDRDDRREYRKSIREALPLPEPARFQPSDNLIRSVEQAGASIPHWNEINARYEKRFPDLNSPEARDAWDWMVAQAKRAGLVPDPDGPGFIQSGIKNLMEPSALPDFLRA
jgi:hypothetical protein